MWLVSGFPGSGVCVYVSGRGGGGCVRVRACVCLGNCCFNCRAWAESQRQCALHCCWGAAWSERSPTFAAHLHLPAHDLFWAEGPAPPPCSWSLLGWGSSSTSLLMISSGLRVQLHLPTHDLFWAEGPAPPPCSWSLLGWVSSSTSLLMISSGLRVQLHLPDHDLFWAEGPAPPPCSWSLLGSGSSSTSLLMISSGLRVQLHLPAHDLFWAEGPALTSLLSLDFTWNLVCSLSVPRPGYIR